MIEAAEQALAFIDGRERADLDRDKMLQLALTRAVEIVGEAASQVSESGRAELPAIAWPQVIGMRNRLVHAYFDLNLSILWDTVQLALPPCWSSCKRSVQWSDSRWPLPILNASTSTRQAGQLIRVSYDLAFLYVRKCCNVFLIKGHMSASLTPCACAP